MKAFLDALESAPMPNPPITNVASRSTTSLSSTVALTIMLVAQAVPTLASLTVPVIATLIAADSGFSVALIGYYGALIMLGAMLAAILGAPIVSKLGSIRSSQLMLIVAAGGLLLHPTASYAGFAIGGFLIGCGYGPANSAGSTLLRRVVSPHRRSLVFSIKQTSIPLGGAAAGILVPFLAGSLNWQTATIGIAVVCCATALGMEPWRISLDADREATVPGGILDPIRFVLRTPPVLRLALGRQFSAWCSFHSKRFS